MDEDWEVLRSFLPANWQELAQESGTRKLTKPDPNALGEILYSLMTFIYPPEVIKEHGDLSDWRNVVGTGPFELTDWVEGSSMTWIKNPNYWGYDEKYPENRLPYLDGLQMLVMPEEATRVAALRSAKIDLLAAFLGWSALSSMDQVDSLRKTNPELVLEPFSFRSSTSWTANSRRPPFDDVRVRHALQMALDLDTINATYWKGYADTTPQGYLGAGIVGHVTHLQTGLKRSRDTIPMTRKGQKRCLTRLDIRAAPTALDSRPSWKWPSRLGHPC